MLLKFIVRDILKVNDLLYKRGLRLVSNSGYLKMIYPAYKICLRETLNILKAVKSVSTPHMIVLTDEIASAIAAAKYDDYWQNIIDSGNYKDTFLGKIICLCGAQLMTLQTFNKNIHYPYHEFLASLEEIKSQSAALEVFYRRLADESSRLAFDHLFRCRIARPFLVSGFQECFPMPVPTGVVQATRKQIDTVKGCLPMLEGAMTDEWESLCVTIWLREQYRLPGKCEVTEGDVVFDVGGCFGETAIYFSRFCGDAGKVFSFEPHAWYFSHLQRNVAPYRAIHPVHAGLGVEDAEVSMEFNGKVSPAAIRTIDGFVEAFDLRHIDFIKMDIEGAERCALTSAVSTMRKMRPKLAISVYHLPDDLRVLSQIIHDAYGDACSIYMKNVTNTHNETVLFVVPDAI
ncbi:MAG: FkbM family methyltransferase [Desulfovibrio sp.]|jgi:FkbM family methyltransferase|nr:FkbM family methyltransferase [Desulfovibrio sp.]